MARRAATLSLTTTKKVRKTRSPKIHDQKYFGHEPDWTNVAEWDESTFLANKHKAYNWYNYFETAKDLRKNLFKWMTDQKYTKNQINAVKSVHDSKISITLCANATMLLRGMPDAHSGWLRDRVGLLIEEGAIIIKETKIQSKLKSYVPSIQERMKEKFQDHMGEIEGIVDNFYNTGNAEHNLFNWLKTKKVAQAHGKLIAEFYHPMVIEMEALMDKTCDEDLKEGYAHLKKKDVIACRNFFQSMIDDANAYTATKKATRKTRKVKPKSKDKIVANVKFMPECNPLKVMSISPVDILGAKEVWVYNVKKRKLGKYVAKDDGYGKAELGIKGTTILNFDETLSIQKTLRNPKVQLMEHRKAGKVALRTFLENIKAIDIKMNGRLNMDTLILKAV